MGCRVCLATEVKGSLSPCCNPSDASGLAERGQPASPEGRSGAAQYSRQGAGGRLQRLAPQEETKLHPNFPARVQRALTSSWQFACNSCLIPLSFFLMVCSELAQVALLLKSIDSGV